ncbi:MAG TPA: EF-P beta-lysylation protein EpmB [Gammaproteobacteria bacterium]
MPEALLAAPRPRRWREALRDAVRSPAELAALLDLPPAAVAGAADPDFPLLVPRSFVARMRKGDPDDPLLKQVLPTAAESLRTPGYVADPVGEHGIAAGGVLQKYPHRALLIATAACPVHCRYCFRRAFPYSSQLASRDDFGPAVAALARLDDVREVILSGGDPLSLGNARLGRLVERLEGVPSLRILRIHTRFPVMLPERVDEGLLALLRRTRLAKVVVLHCNHPNELDAEVAAAAAALREAGATLLNQSVLLEGVNDDADTLARLSERLFEAGVLPYYLHLLDPVQGAAHFDVPAARGLELVAELRARLPGYLVPRLVREDAGRLSKTPVA